MFDGDMYLKEFEIFFFLFVNKQVSMENQMQHLNVITQNLDAQTLFHEDVKVKNIHNIFFIQNVISSFGQNVSS